KGFGYAGVGGPGDLADSAPTQHSHRPPPRAHSPAHSTIDDLISGELTRGINEITASIPISGSDVVAARSVSGIDTPPTPTRAPLPAREAQVTTPLRPVSRPSREAQATRPMVPVEAPAPAARSTSAPPI